MRPIAAYSRVLCSLLDAVGLTYRLEHAFLTHIPLSVAARELRFVLLQIPSHGCGGKRLAALAVRIETAIAAFLATTDTMPEIRSREIDTLRSYLPGLAAAHRAYDRVPRKGAARV